MSSAGPVTQLQKRAGQFLDKLDTYDDAYYADMQRYADASGITELLNDLIKEGERYGVRVVYFLNATPHGFKQDFAIYNALPTTHRISLHKFNQLRQLVDLQFWYDEYHLNHLGARIVSEEFARILCKRLNDGSFIAPMSESN